MQKIDRVSETWGLERIGDRLRERRADGNSLRDLDPYFSEAVLRSAMESAGMDTLPGEQSYLYRLLTDDDVGAGKRVDAESRLRRAGRDPSSVTGDFVSYQTVRAHLNDCLDVETTREAHLAVGEARNTGAKHRRETALANRISHSTDDRATRTAGVGDDQGTVSYGESPRRLFGM